MCYLKIADEDSGVLDIVEVFKADNSGRVEKIRAL
tara:strand:- start:95 stop:199 length:105 start_codon:yes stop_codon:yes gene_type:complete